MKVAMRRAIAVLITICLTICGLVGINELTRLKASYARDLSHKSYYDCAEDYDVLFLGTSHMMHGVNPLEIWKEYGIRSYNWSSPSCTIPMMYWKLKCILQIEKPKMLVVDCYRAIWGHRGFNVERMHQAFDAFPFSMVKYQAVQDLMSDPEKFTEQDKFNMLFSLGAYHTRWDDLQRVDFENNYVDTKGSEFEIKVAEPIEIFNTNEKLEITDEMTGMIYLRKIIEECQENNIQVLLTYLPYPTTELWKKEANTISDIAKEYDVEYIDFTRLDVVNYDIDYADASSHMNISGQNKVSSYLGKYICENFDIPDRRSELMTANEWNILYEEYLEDRYSKVKAAKALNNYLMLGYGLSLDYVIEVRDKEIFKSKVFLDLLEQLGVEKEEITAETSHIILKNGESLAVSDFRESEKIDEVAFGDIILFLSDEGNYSLRLNSNEYVIETDDYDMKILIFRQGDIFDSVSIKYNVDGEFKVHQTEFTRE